MRHHDGRQHFWPIILLVFTIDSKGLQYDRVSFFYGAIALGVLRASKMPCNLNISHIAAISFDIKVCPRSETKVRGAPYLLMTSRYSTAATFVASWVLRGCASIHLE